jgi:leucyl aminopeptidase
MKISFTDERLPNKACLILAVTEGPKWGKAAKALSKKTDGQLEALAETNRFTGKKGETLTLIAPAGLTTPRLVLVGLGDEKNLTEQSVEEAGGSAYTALPVSNLTDVAAVVDVGPAASLEPAVTAAHFAQGFVLRSYRFDKYFTARPDIKKPTLQNVTLQVEEKAKAQKAYNRLEAIAAGVFFARNLVSEPANVIYPQSLARECEKLKKFGVSVDVLDVKQMKTLGMGALLGVGQGSANPSRLISLTYRGNPKAKDKRPVAFIGKGVTFDTGGISLKPASGMEDMKYDMAGSAAVIGAVYALAAREAKVNVVGIIGAVENMPSGNAQRPGDVVTSMSGQTIEVINTDAEGRLVLCDLLTYTQKKFKPRAMVNLATLTGAIILALGNEHAGLFSNNDEFSEQLTAAGLKVNEKLWRFPMNDVYDKQLNSDIADMKNASNERVAGSIFGAQFLARFVDKKVPWAHLDIAGMAWAKRDLALVPRGATAYGVRLLEKLVTDYYEGK